jgi:hypothetical protein
MDRTKKPTPMASIRRSSMRALLDSTIGCGGLAHHRLIAVKLAIPAGIKVREARPTVLIRIS